MKKRIENRINPLIAIGLLTLLIYSCNKEEKTQVPVLTTSPVTSINQTKATCGGNIITDSGFPITAIGVCWSTVQAPETGDNKTLSGFTIGSFTDTITSLTANTVYYVRAYATNSAGTAYGNEISFTTSPAILPSLTTKAPNSVTQTSAISGGYTTTDGGAPITVRGICWSTTENPSIALITKTTDGIGTGAFTSSLSGLTMGFTYYVRAYATNSIGTSYGEQKSFTLDPAHLTDVDGNVYDTITIGTQTWMKENLKTTSYLDGSPIPNITNSNLWGRQTVGSYCWYNDAVTNKGTYGALYNFYTVQDSRELCPIGWHVPSKEEWAVLTTYLGGESVAGKKLMESGSTHWQPFNSATNESGFTALPGGDRYNNGFYFIGGKGSWWTSTEYDSDDAWSPAMASSYIDVRTYQSEKFVGLSVRCVKDL